MSAASIDRDPRVILLTRSSCMVCAPAREVVQRVCADAGERWREVRIDGDASLQAEYGDRVPMVLLDGEEFASLMVDADDLAAALRP